MNKNAKKIILATWLLSTSVTLTFCQNITKQSMKANTLQPKDLDSLVASYTTMPAYYVDYSNSGCMFEIRINDGYTEKLFDPGNSGGTLLPINTEILKSGKQTFWVRLYPNPGEKVMTAKNPFTLEIGYKDFKVESGTEGRPWHSVYKMPPVVVPDSGLPYYEFSGEFEATVPYQIKGWSDCIDLREIPDIEQRVVAKFNELRELRMSKQVDKYNAIVNEKNMELAVCFYKSTSEYDSDIQDDNKNLLNKEAELYQPIEDYNLVFYCDGRLVTLESKKLGGFPSSLLWLKEIEGGTRYTVYDMRLGIRQGTNELIPIR